MIRKEIYKFYEDILNFQFTLSKKLQYKNQRTEFSEEDFYIDSSSRYNAIKNGKEYNPKILLMLLK